MNLKELATLQRIIAGDEYQEHIIDKAILIATEQEDIVSLKALKAGRPGNLHMSVTLQDFANKLTRKLKWDAICEYWGIHGAHPVWLIACNPKYYMTPFYLFSAEMIDVRALPR